jgi:hypothetical protein
MKTLLAGLTVAVAASLCACAPQPLTKGEVDGRIVCNSDRMDQVERKARREGTELHWVNCPTARLRAV